MKAIKNNSISQKIILAISLITVAICGVLIYSAITNNAFATEERAVAEPNEDISAKQESNSIQISFDIKGVDEDDAPNFKLRDSSGDVDYKLGDKISVNKDTLNATYSTDYKAIRVYNNEGERCSYQFTWTCLGYDFDSFEPLDKPAVINQDTDFVITLKKSTKPYTIGITARQWIGEELISLPDVTVTYYDLNYRRIAGPVVTDSYGKCTFDNLSKDEAVGIITYKREDLCDQLFLVKEEHYQYDDGHLASLVAPLEDVSNADVILNSNDHVHIAFDLKTYSGLSTEPEKENLLSHYFSDSLAVVILNTSYDTYATANEDGTVDLYTSFSGMPRYWRAEITPLCENGHFAKSWVVDVGNNEAQPLNPGQTITIPAGSKFSGYPVYNAAPPQPGPDPTPTEESNTAQTGDCALLVPFVLLAVLAGGVLLYTRKFAKN